MSSKGVYRRVHQVVDVWDQYYLAAEYHYCPECSWTFPSTDPRLVDQLADGLLVPGPAHPVVRLLQSRPGPPARPASRGDLPAARLRQSRPGATPTAFSQAIAELHSEGYCLRVQAYLADCRRHQ